MATEGDSIKTGVSTEIVPPAPKKPKTETATDSDSDSDTFMYTGRRFRKPRRGDEEYDRQNEEFYYEFNRSEGFEISWDKYDYPFVSFSGAWGVRFDSEMSNEEVIDRLTKYAIAEENEEEGSKLELVEVVNVNAASCQGYVYWITFRAKDLSLPNSEPKLYQTKVWDFLDETEVLMFRPRPSDEEIASVYVAPFPIKVTPRS